MTGAPTPPMNVMVAPQGDLQASITWSPSFISFGLTATYNIYVDGQLEVAAINKPSYIFTRMQPSCDTYEVIIEAVNEVGSQNATESLSLTLPSSRFSNGSLITRVLLYYINHEKNLCVVFLFLSTRGF